VNEQLQGKLVEILSAIQSATKAAGDFALEHLPEIAQQYVMYGRVTSTLWSFLGAGFALLGWLAMKQAKAEGHFEWKYVSAFKDFGGGYWIGALLTLVGGVMFAHSIDQAFLAWFAPKVWLLKEIAGLIK
jgi:hypothetical protein